MAWFLLALPHFAIPLLGPYRPPLASLFLLLWAGLACCTPATVHLRLFDDTRLRRKLLAFFAYSALSSAYGYWELSQADRLTLHLTTGDVGYVGVAAQRLFQLLLAILTFEIVRQSRIPAVRLMRWWLYGTAIAVALHIFVYIASSDSLTQRAGVFTEGNLGGLYYLLSVFVALEYLRRGHRSGLTFAGSALAGILMTASTAAILVLALTLSFAYVTSAPGAGATLRRTLLAIVVITSIAALMYGTESDLGIGEKLFEEEVTSKSFSRIDRLASIDTAIELFIQSPWLGQGLQTYGFLSNDYLDGPLLSIYDESFRRIPNNIYAELAAEMGIVGLLLFGTFMVSLVRRIAFSPADKGKNLLAAVLAVMCYWLAFPTYSVVFVWAFFGLTLAALRTGQSHTTRSPQARHIEVQLLTPGDSGSTGEIAY